MGAFPSKIPMIDVVTVGAGGGSIAWLSPEGTLKVGPQSAGADPGPLCYGKGGTEVTITDAHVVLGRIPPHLLGGEIPLDVDAARAGVEALASKLGLSPEACATGVLEISAWNQANALRQVTVKRGLDVRDFTLTTFGGSGSLLLCRLMDVLGIPTVLVPPNPGNVSAFGLLTVDVKNDYVQTHVALADALDPATVAAAYDDLTVRAAAALTGGGLRRRAAPVRADGRPALLRPGLRGAGRGVRPAPSTRRVLDEVASRFHAEHRALYGYDFSGDDDPAGRVGQPPGLRHRPDHSAPRSSGLIGRSDDSPAELPSRRRSPDRSASTPSRGRTSTRPSCGGRTSVVGQVVPGPAIIEEFGSTVPVHPGFEVRVDDYLNLIVTRSQA